MRWTSRPLGTLASIWSRNLRNSVGKQRGCAMPLVVMATPGNLAGPHGQHGLAAVQRLNLAFLVDAKHDCMLWGRHVKADDIAHFGNEVRIGRKLECLDLRLQAKRPPDALHGRDRDSRRLGHAARTPMRGILRQTFQRFHNDRFDTGILDRARHAGTRLVMQTVDSPLDNLRRHLPTVFLATPKPAATSWFSKPCAHSRTMRTRSADACALFRRDESCFNSARSVSLRTSSAITRAI